MRNVPGSALIPAAIVFTGVCIALVVRDWLRDHAVPSVVPVPSTDRAAVSVLVPARDEADRIGPLLDGLARQTASGFEVVVLDDHSTDSTAAVVMERAELLPRLRLLQGRPLPDGWAGKCWACWQAAEASRHPWLLFLDADTAPEPALIASLLKHATRHHFDLVSVLPLLRLETFWERTLLPPFMALLEAVFPPTKVRDPRSTIALANGPCILIRREAYFAAGGHRAVRASILEDVHLARVVKAAGYRIELARGLEVLGVRMYTGLGEIAEGLRKNASAGFRAGGRRSAWEGLRQGVLATAPLVLLLGWAAMRAAGRPRSAAPGLCALLLGATEALYWGDRARRLYRLNPLWGLAFPLGTLLYYGLSAGAWLRVRRGDGVAWKGRRYSG